MNIDRCYCFDRSFAELREVADETGAKTVEELQDETVFGHNCQLCHPYVSTMLRTRQTVFHHIIEKEITSDSELGR